MSLHEDEFFGKAMTPTGNDKAVYPRTFTTAGTGVIYTPHNDEVEQWQRAYSDAMNINKSLRHQVDTLEGKIEMLQELRDVDMKSYEKDMILMEGVIKGLKATLALLRAEKGVIRKIRIRR